MLECIKFLQPAMQYFLLSVKLQSEFNLNHIMIIQILQFFMHTHFSKIRFKNANDWYLHKNRVYSFASFPMWLRLCYGLIHTYYLLQCRKFLISAMQFFFLSVKFQNEYNFNHNMNLKNFPVLHAYSFIKNKRTVFSLEDTKDYESPPCIHAF